METVAPGEKGTASSVLQPGSTSRPLSQKTRRSKGRTHGNLFKQEVKPAAAKGILSESWQRFFTHGLRHMQHVSCDSPVRFMMYSEATSAFISLHSDNTVSLHKDGDQKRILSLHLPFIGLTATKIHGCVVGWGPGPIFTLMDSEFFPLDAAQDALDIRVCQAVEHSTELVTAGAGNVCVWSVMLMRCKVRIQEGLQESQFTHMALSPPRPERPYRAFLVCGKVVTVVDLDGRRVLEHKNNLCSCNITAVEYCFQLDCLIIASQEFSITVWGPTWDKRATFSGHTDVVNSLFYCSDLNMLMSSSADCTIRCWNVEDCEAVDCVSSMDQENPPLYIGGIRKGHNFFTFSHKGVDFWTMRSLYTLHCRLRGDIDAPVRQILVSSYPAPYPTRVLCVSGDSNITLVAADTGAVLTSFETNSRILCADYCLPKEILLVLTESGTLLKANTLTVPITLMQEWKGRGLGPWQLVDHVTEQEVRNLTTPGPACCMALYSYVPEKEQALEEWASLQENRVCSRKSKAARDAKNMFLIILGQSGGCVSVLKINNGQVFYRTPAHDGQRVTTVQVYPENNYLLSTGEDLTVVVWTVNPHIKECLTQQLSLHCGQPQVHLAVLESQLVLSYEEPNSSSYILKHFSLLSHYQTDYQPRKGHSDRFTGLCVLPDLNLFVSSSLDKTVRFWNKEGSLIRTLQLNAVPECITHSGFGDELFLGIRGDLYRMSCAKFLPYSYQQTLLNVSCAEPLPDLLTGKKEICTERQAYSTPEDEKKESQPIARSPLSTKDMDMLITSNMDLQALLKGTVKCKKEKPPSTKKTRKEAFDCYMKLLYGLPNYYMIDLENTFDLNKFSVYSASADIRPCDVSTLKEDTQPQSTKNFPVNVKKKKKERASTLMKLKPPPAEKRKTPDTEHPKMISPIDESKPKTPTPPTPYPSAPTPPQHLYRTPTPPHAPTPHFHHRTPTPLPQREPSPQMVAYLRQFEGMGWFTDLYPDKKSIPSCLSPEDFTLLVLTHLQTCTIQSRLKLLAAVQALHSQGLLQNTDKLFQGLMDSMNKFARPHMSPLERIVLVDMLNLLVHLKPDSAELMKKLLTLLAYKELDLQETVLGMLSLLGVGEAEHWLWPEVENWGSILQGHSDTWKSLHDKAESWLYLWISKLKEHNGYLHLRSKAKWKTPTFTMVDVLNYFCSVQKEEYRKSRYVVPTGRKDTVLLPLYDCSQPILRLGETHSMARTRKPTGLVLPPLRDHPFLSHVPNFIPLPLPRITLRPFHVYSDEDWVKAPTRHYFILQQSWVEYYK